MKLKRILVSAAAAIGLAVPMVAVATPTPAQAACNMSSWTWPVCELSAPSIPRFDPGAPRPPLTPRNSAWCRNDYIAASKTGYTYWALVQNDKINLRFWPDYYSRYYQAMYWNGRQWAWVPVNDSYPNVALGQRVDCDA